MKTVCAVLQSKDTVVIREQQRGEDFEFVVACIVEQLSEFLDIDIEEIAAEIEAFYTDKIEYSEESECPKCGWDADGADECYLVDVINEESVTAPGFPMRTKDWEEIWKCPECKKLFKVENCNY